MADPFSITTGVVALLTVCVKVGWGLKAFGDGAALADTKVRSLLTDVESFTHVLQLMKDTFDQERVQQSLHVTGHVGGHWANLAASIRDGLKTLEQLEALLEKTNKSARVLDAARKHFRLKEATDEILMYQQQIRSYRDTLQLSLQTVILWNQVTFQESTNQILPNLDVLHMEIRRLAFDFNARMSGLQNMVQSNSSNDQLETLTNLRNCVKSAATVVSSASTILDIASEQSILGSDFGDDFPSEPSEPMLRWISSNTVYDFREENEAAHESNNTARKYTETADARETDDVDSDNDLEVEIFEALFDRAKSVLHAGYPGEAGNLLKNCMSRIPKPSGSPSYIALQLEIGDLLLGAYYEDEKWDEAASLLTERIEMGLQTDELLILRDYTSLARLLQDQGHFGDAIMYARRALKGYRRLGSPYIGKLQKVLELLMQICSNDENEMEWEAYNILLENSKAQHGDGLGTSPEVLVNQPPQTSRGRSVLEQEQPNTASSQVQPSSEEMHQTTTQGSSSSTGNAFSSSSGPAVSFFPNVNESRSIVFVGHAGSGKTTFINKAMPGSSPPTGSPMAYQYTFFPIEGSLFQLVVTEISTRNQRRKLDYSGAQVVVICFPIDDVDELPAVYNDIRGSGRHTLTTEARMYSPRSPVVLLGLKLDLRYKERPPKKSASRQNGENVAKVLGAVKYLECSAETGEGVKEAIRAISEIALAQPRKSKEILTSIVMGPFKEYLSSRRVYSKER